MENDFIIDGDLCHELLAKKIERKLAYNPEQNYPEWRAKVREKLIELLGIREIEKNACPLQMKVEEEKRFEGYCRIRFVFESEKGACVPCYLCVPDTGKEKYPLVICLQGHSSGFHNDIGEPKEGEKLELRGATSLQAIENGFAALTIEQRGMGERKTRRHGFDPLMCTFTAMTALQLGRTVIGERVWDVQRAIDLIGQFPQIDINEIYMTGGSGGGTATFYTACLDERIKLAIPGYALCSYKTSTEDIFHCPCNYIPNISQWFEMGDLSCLIAPRALLVVAGEEDRIFPINGVKESYETVQKIYEQAGVKNNCHLLVTPKGHFWMPELIWPEIHKVLQKK